MRLHWGTKEMISGKTNKKNSTATVKRQQSRDLEIPVRWGKHEQDINEQNEKAGKYSTDKHCIISESFNPHPTKTQLWFSNKYILCSKGILYSPGSWMDHVQFCITCECKVRFVFQFRKHNLK